MALFKLPRLRLHDQSQPDDTGVHSLLISLVRGLAALQVAAAHLRAEVFPSLRGLADPPLVYQGLAFVTGFAHQAVVLFFLISGWLVGGSLLNKMAQPGAIASYAIDRASRLWTVLIPTFVFILLLGLATDVLKPGALDYSAGNAYSLLSFAGNLVGLQTVTVANFGGNYALWSLANETWYYLLFPLLLLVFSSRAGAARIAAAGAIIVIVASIPYDITLYFAIWLLGVGFSRLRLDCGKLCRIALLFVLAVASLYYRLKGSNDDLEADSFIQDVVCSLPFLLLLASARMKADPSSLLVRKVGPAARLFSDFSFTLYVMHVPLIGMLRHMARSVRGSDQLSPFVASDYGLYLVMLLAVLAGAYLSYLLFESQTYRIRRAAKSLLLQRPTPAAARAGM